jgi:adenylate kinase family enzyme
VRREDQREEEDGAAGLGRRVAIYGPTGSGKSTLARLIGARLGVPAVELDALFHRPGWQPTPDDEFRAAVFSKIAECEDGWIFDGNYSAVRDIILSRADTVIWLRLPFHVVFRRLLGRTLRRAWTCEMLWGTNRESWRKTFLHRDSILLWSLTSWKPHVRRTAEALRTIPNQASVVTLRSPREVGAFVGALEGQEPGRDAIGGDA